LDNSMDLNPSLFLITARPKARADASVREKPCPDLLKLPSAHSELDTPCGMKSSMVAAMCPSNTRTTSMGRYSSSSTCIFAMAHIVLERFCGAKSSLGAVARMRSISENVRGACEDVVMDLSVAPQLARPHKMLDTSRTPNSPTPDAFVSPSACAESIRSRLVSSSANRTSSRTSTCAARLSRASRRRPLLLFALPRRWKAVE